MNLHAIASAVTGAVNPQLTLSVRFSTGNTVADDGTPVPSYSAPTPLKGDVQSLTFGDLRQLEGVNMAGKKRAIYVNGALESVVRFNDKGGDLITLPDGTVWLVAMVLEQWPTWCKVAVTLQNGS